MSFVLKAMDEPLCLQNGECFEAVNNALSGCRPTETHIYLLSQSSGDVLNDLLLLPLLGRPKRPQLERSTTVTTMRGVIQ
jgi:hypothetical protein